MTHTQLNRETRIMLDRAAIQEGIRRKRSIQKSTQKLYERRLNRLKAWCEGQGIKYKKIRGRDFAEYLCDLHEDGYNYHYLRGAWTGVQIRVSGSGREERVRNVLTNIKAEDKHRHKQAVSITGAEIDRSMARCGYLSRRVEPVYLRAQLSAQKRAQKYYVAFLFMFYCGLRSAELTAIEWEHVTSNDDGKGTLHIEQSKCRYNDPYTKPVPAPVMYQWNLMRMASSRRKPFPTYRYLLRALKTADEAAGLNRGFTTHSFKVGMANLLVQQGYSTKQIADAMVWKSEWMVHYYTRNNPGKFNALREIGKDVTLSSLWVGAKWEQKTA